MKRGIKYISIALRSNKIMETAREWFEYEFQDVKDFI